MIRSVLEQSIRTILAEGENALRLIQTSSLFGLSTSDFHSGLCCRNINGFPRQPALSYRAEKRITMMTV